MDFPIIIMGVLICIVCIVPFVAIRINTLNREKPLIKGINLLANTNNCNVSKYEICANTIIGIDEKNRRLFYFSNIDNAEKSKTISLNDINKCKILNSSKKVGEGKESYNIVDKLELSFTFKNNNKKEENWLFYDANKSAQLVGELILVENWKKIVERYIVD